MLIIKLGLRFHHPHPKHRANHLFRVFHVRISWQGFNALCVVNLLAAVLVHVSVRIQPLQRLNIPLLLECTHLNVWNTLYMPRRAGLIVQLPRNVQAFVWPHARVLLIHVISGCDMDVLIERAALCSLDAQAFRNLAVRMAVDVVAISVRVESFHGHLVHTAACSHGIEIALRHWWRENAILHGRARISHGYVHWHVHRLHEFLDERRA